MANVGLSIAREFVTASAYGDDWLIVATVAASLSSKL